MIKLLLVLLFSINLFAQQRIVALSPAVNEIIFALGDGDKIVGNTSYCNFPEESKKISKVGGYFNPSLEKIIALKPDLVIMQQNNYRLDQKLKKLHIKTQIIKINRLKNIKKSILDIGTTLNKEKKAKEIVASIDNELRLIKNIITNKKILIVFGHNLSLISRIFVAGQNIYFDDIINESSNINAFQSDRKGQPVLGLENIIATNPDIVILLAHSRKEKGLQRDELLKPWKTLPINAVRSDSIYIFDNVNDGIPSDRIIYFLKDFRTLLNDYKTRVSK